jgi:hypothetical protein
MARGGGFHGGFHGRGYNYGRYRGYGYGYDDDYYDPYSYAYGNDCPVVRVRTVHNGRASYRSVERCN